MFQKKLLENVKLFLFFFCQIFSIQKVPSEIASNALRLSKENVLQIPLCEENLKMTPNFFKKKMTFLCNFLEAFRGLE